MNDNEIVELLKKLVESDDLVIYVRSGNFGTHFQIRYKDESIVEYDSNLRSERTRYL